MWSVGERKEWRITQMYLSRVIGRVWVKPALRGISAIKIRDILNFKCLLVPRRSKELDAQVSNLAEELETEISISQLSTIWHLKPTIVLGKMTKEVSWEENKRMSLTSFIIEIYKMKQNEQRRQQRATNEFGRKLKRTWFLKDKWRQCIKEVVINCWDK